MAEVSVSSASWSCKLLALLPIMIREALRRLGQGRQKERKWGDPRKLFARRCGTSLSLVPGWRFISQGEGRDKQNSTSPPPLAFRLPLLTTPLLCGASPFAHPHSSAPHPRQTAGTSQEPQCPAKGGGLRLHYHHHNHSSSIFSSV
jgi:hypothetical protein